jgi:hypothetical protein
VLGWFVSAVTLLAVRRRWGYAPSSAVSHPRRFEVQQHGCELLRLLSYLWSHCASNEPVLLVLVMTGFFHLFSAFCQGAPIYIWHFLVGLSVDSPFMQLPVAEIAAHTSSQSTLWSHMLHPFVYCDWQLMLLWLLLRHPVRKRPLGRPKSRCENNINMFRVYKFVRHHTFNWINQQDAATFQVYYLSFGYSWTCFGHPHARNMLSCIQTTSNKLENLPHLVGWFSWKY